MMERKKANLRGNED